MLGWNENWTRPRVTLPVASVLQTEWFTCSIGHEIGQVCGTCTHPAGFTGLNAAGYIITWKKWILRPESHRHRLLYERSAILALPRRNETGAPARTCTSNLRLRTATCRALTPRELKLRHAGAAPARAVWKTAMRAATSMMLNLLPFAEVVAEFGIAPNSPRLQRGANLSQLFSLKTGPSTR